MKQPYIQETSSRRVDGQQIFFCVYSLGTSDFILQGLFTKEEDALVFYDNSPTKGDRNGCRPPIRQTFSQVADQIASYRLGVLAEILFPKEAAALEGTNGSNNDQG